MNSEIIKPYTSANDFFKAYTEHGKFFGKSNNSEKCTPILFNDKEVFIFIDGSPTSFVEMIKVSYENLVSENYFWIDGSPCGHIKNKNNN